MADKSNKVPENVSGKYYVDSECISCGLCVSTAPEVFEMNGDDKAYVKKQPAPEDMEGVLSSMDACPVTAIGDDG
jgi:ferredoxin